MHTEGHSHITCISLTLIFQHFIIYVAFMVAFQRTLSQFWEVFFSFCVNVNVFDEQKSRFIKRFYVFPKMFSSNQFVL